MTKFSLSVFVLPQCRGRAEALQQPLCHRDSGVKVINASSQKKLKRFCPFVVVFFTAQYEAIAPQIEAKLRLKQISSILKQQPLSSRVSDTDRTH